MKKKGKRNGVRRRPVKHTVPDEILGTPEGIVMAIFAKPPPGEWECMKKHGKRGRSQER